MKSGVGRRALKAYESAKEHLIQFEHDWMHLFQYGEYVGGLGI